VKPIKELCEALIFEFSSKDTALQCIWAKLFDLLLGGKEMAAAVLRCVVLVGGIFGLSCAPLAAQPTPPPLEAYGALPEVEDIALSPSGKRLAMLMTSSNARAIVIMNEALEPIFSIGLEDTKVRRFDFVTDDLLVMERSSTEDLGYQFTQDRLEMFQAFVISIDQQTSELVFEDRRGVMNAIFGNYGTRIVNGKPMGFYGAIELQRGGSSQGNRYIWNHGRPALYSVDLASNSSRRIANSAPSDKWRDWLIGASGETVAQLEVSELNGTWTIRGPRNVIARGQTATGSVNLVAIGRDGTTIIYAAQEKGEDLYAWFEVPIDGSTSPVEVYSNEGIERIFTDPRSGRLIGYRRDSGADPMVFFDPKMASRVRNVQRAFGAYANTITDWSPSFDHVLVRISGNGDSGSHFKVDMRATRASAVAYERDSIRADQVGPISVFPFSAADGLEMDGILTLPPGQEAKNLPVILLPHGGPRSHNIAEFDWWAQAFASRGYAVFQPNFRGSTNRDQTFMLAGTGDWGGKMQTDISDGLAALAEAGIVDPARACIVGASYGGYAALAGVTLQQGLYRCAVSVNGVSDINLLWINERRRGGTSPLESRALKELFGPPSQYRALSPRHNAEKADAPILLIHGRDDTVVDFDHSSKMADALDDAGKVVQLMPLDGEDHWLSLAETRLAMLRGSVAFVLEHNPPD
jgi:dipeptidyl aminopeptidase/acylaminoacyl peptidase